MKHWCGIPNTILNRAEVQAFIAFLKENTPTQSLRKTKNTRDQFEELFQKWSSEKAISIDA